MKNSNSDNIHEAMKITGRDVSALNSLHLTDPRTNETCKICYQREGHFSYGGKVYNGTYMVYNDPTMEKSYAGVFVAEELGEDEAGIKPVTLVAIDPVKHRVINRTRYRARVSERAVEEQARFRRGK